MESGAEVVAGPAGRGSRVGSAQSGSLRPLGISRGYDQASMKHMSNRERIERAAEEARLDEAEKVAKKTTKTSRSAAKAVRMKIVWEVCNAAGTAVKTFSYPERTAAESAILELTKTSGRPHMLRAAKVPME